MVYTISTTHENGDSGDDLLYFIIGFAELVVLVVTEFSPLPWNAMEVRVNRRHAKELASLLLQSI
jgi:hypothetical protein